MARELILTGGGGGNNKGNVRGRLTKYTQDMSKSENCSQQEGHITAGQCLALPLLKKTD